MCMGESAAGRGRGRAYSRARENQYRIESYDSVQSHLARGARESALALEKGSNFVVQCSPNKTPVGIGKIHAGGAKRRPRWRGGFLDFFVLQSGSKIQKPKIFGGEDFLEGNAHT